MISIIVCSKHSSISLELSHNINETIGDVQYELIWIDNSQNKFSIFQAYNEGVRRSKGEYLCFMHEDVLFRSMAWGDAVIKMFGDKTVGMIGVIGTAYLGITSLYWWNNYSNKGRIIQGQTKKGKYVSYNDVRTCSGNNEVVAVDGLWICFCRDLFTKGYLCWDEINYSGFHFYDMDISLQVFTAGYKAKVADGILIEHMSKGRITNEYMDSLLIFHRKWNGILPIFTPSYMLPKKYNPELEVIKEYTELYKWYLKDEQILGMLPFRCLRKLFSLFK